MCTALWLQIASLTMTLHAWSDMPMSSIQQDQMLSHQDFLLGIGTLSISAMPGEGGFLHRTECVYYVARVASDIQDGVGPGQVVSEEAAIHIGADVGALGGEVVLLDYTPRHGVLARHG